MNAVAITNKMIDVYLNTPIEKYPEARAIDVLDDYSINDPNRHVAFSLFQEWLDLKEHKSQNGHGIIKV